MRTIVSELVLDCARELQRSATRPAAWRTSVPRERRHKLIGKPSPDTWAADTLAKAEKAVRGIMHRPMTMEEKIADRRTRRVHWSEPPILFQMETGPYQDASPISAEPGRAGLKAFCDEYTAEEIRDQRRCGHCGAGWPYPPGEQNYLDWLTSDYRWTTQLEERQKAAVQAGCCPVCFVPAGSAMLEQMDDGTENYAADRRGLYDGVAEERQREQGPQSPGTVIPVNFGKGGSRDQRHARNRQRKGPQ